MTQNDNAVRKSFRRIVRPSIRDAIRDSRMLTPGKSYDGFHLQNNPEVRRFLGDQSLGRFVLVYIGGSQALVYEESNFGCRRDGEARKFDSRVIFLADFGVTTYEDGSWNKTNYLVPSN